MPAFWDAYDRTRRQEALGSGSQGDTRGVCAFCGLEDEDVLLGCCAACADDDD